MSDTYDVAVVGGGPAGYVAALRAAQLGLRVACIDARADADGKPALGGTCLNVGCIPSKALLDSSHHFATLQSGLGAHGIAATGVAMDVGKMQARKDKIVSKLTGGIKMLFAANKVDAIHGRAQLQKDNSVTVTELNSTTRRQITARHIILAPGSIPVQLPAAQIENASIVDSSGALEFTETPRKLGIIGAGVIGLELGSVWNRLGAQVVLLEAAPEFLPSADRQIAREAARQFKRQGLDIRLGAKLEHIVQTSAGLQLNYQQSGESAAAEHIAVDKVIVAVGRRPATEALCAADCAVRFNARGYIEVDAFGKTAAENVWAVGDAVRGPMLAHKASAEGAAVAERIAGAHAEPMDFHTVPWVVYTAPEIAWVGQTEAQLQADEIPVRCGTFAFAANGRALSLEEPAGLVKLIAHAKTDRLLGAHIIGAHASELIGECALALTFQASAEDLARTIHAHPTLSEAVYEAALAVDQRALHQGK